MYQSYYEVFKQGESLEKTIDLIMSSENDICSFFAKKDFDEVVFVACGSSYWLSTSACMTLQEKLGVRCSAITSGEIVMNPDYYKKAFKKPFVIAPSRSGNTSETIIALNFLKENFGSKVLSIIEYNNSAIAGISDLVLEIPWANEISVCQTRSFSNLYLSCIAIAAVVSGDQTLLKDLKKYIAEFEQHSTKAENQLRNIIKEFSGCKSLVTIGNGKQFGITCEGAYICIEMAQFTSNYYNTLELRHGPIVMLDPSYLVTVYSCGNSRKLEENMALDSRKKGAKVAAICAMDDFKNADYCFSLGRNACAETIALYGIMVMQGFAHLKAVDMGIDPDNPKELVPWIKL